ncbi:MAG: ABC transporter family substrate-binding protein [Kineosporiaceae bacterium]
MTGSLPAASLRLTREDLSLSVKRTGTRALALLAGSALALSACTTSSGAGGDDATSQPITITWGYEQEFAAYNASTETGNASHNSVVLNQVLRGFWVYAPDGSIQADSEFGSYAKVSDDPLTVKYSFNPAAVWSDGEPVGCDDITLTWMARNGSTGDKGFSAALTNGYEDMNKPECGAGGKDFTITYKKPFADWSAMFGATEILPAHIVEKQAGMTKTFLDYVDAPTSPELAKAIEFYNTGWNFNPGALKKDIIPSAGPYLIDSWVANQSLTLKANPKWWGTPPKANTIVIRYLAGDAQAQALQNGEIDLMDPQPQVDLVNQLKSLGDEIVYSPEDQYTFEHFDFNFKTVFADKNVREAFAKCVPRQQIVDNLIKPQNAQARIMESRFIFPFQPQYDGYIEGIGGQAYDKQDIAGAKALLEKAGKTGTTVRIGWKKDPEQLNKRRSDTVALLQNACSQAGFKIVDAGTPTFFGKEWPAGQWDVAMFAWAGSPLVTGSRGIYDSTGGQNMGAYSNKKVDELITKLSQEIDRDKQLTLQKQIDQLLWQDLATIPLFAFPGIYAASTNVTGAEYNATQSDLTWNADKWSLK